MADDEATEFWRTFEGDTGEKVSSRSIGEWLRPSAPSLWGLVILTDKSLRFKHLPSENWLESLFKKNPLGKAESDKPVDIVIPLGELEAKLEEKRGIIARIVGPAFPRFTAKRRGEETEYLFSVDPSSGIISALKELSAAKA
jgi:hypothetical protein